MLFSQQCIITRVKWENVRILDMTQVIKRDLINKIKELIWFGLYRLMEVVEI